MKTNIYEYAPIGKRIKQARMLKHYTQAQLADIIGMSSKNLSLIERGLAGISVPTLISLCNALDVSSDYILFGKQFADNSVLGKLISTLSADELSILEKLLSVYTNDRTQK